MPNIRRAAQPRYSLEQLERFAEQQRGVEEEARRKWPKLLREEQRELARQRWEEEADRLLSDLKRSAGLE